MVNKKGFTLIELLGVFVLLAVISLVTFPNVTKMFKNDKKDQYAEFKKNVYLATEAYIESNSSDYEGLKTDGATTNISISTLTESGFLNENLVNPSTKQKINKNSTVTVTKDSNGFTYTFNG